MDNTHSFHIPVMGTGFTIDTPIKVARFGISSVISLVDDNLIEEIRRHYCGAYGEPYHAISAGDRDRREARITAYLNLVDRIVQRQIEEMKRGPFDGKSDLCVYFELLDDANPLKRAYRDLLAMADGADRSSLEDLLRGRVASGSIDVNIMTKADRENSFKGEKLPREYSDAMAALRGYAKSTLRSSIVFSAGLNPYLYSYAAAFDDFYAKKGELPKKKVALKVSDYRSASIQARTLAKRGIWVSEYRVESGLNCGGHAFATTGLLLGPILEEFKARKQELVDTLFLTYQAALQKENHPVPDAPYPVRITAQGGIGTSDEQRFLIERYGVESVGWGTPFLLVPEATAVDTATLEALTAGGKDVYLSRSSPLGVPFYTLPHSPSEELRRERIRSGKPGSPCLNKYLAMNTEFGEALCVASSRYQRLKLDDLAQQGLSEPELKERTEAVLEKACICRDLGDGALIKYGIKEDKKRLAPAVCPGPNIAYFSRICSLREMVDHIYGRASVFGPNEDRPHVFLNELKIYIDYLKMMVSEAGAEPAKKEAAHFEEFKHNLIDGIGYYTGLTGSIFKSSPAAGERFVSGLLALANELEGLILPSGSASPLETV